jgi:uncharacterized protein YjbI with pentapeptide repeats
MITQNHKKNKSKKNILSRRIFLQESLNLNLQNAIFGQSTLVKALLAIGIVSANCFAAILVGLLSSRIMLNLLFLIEDSWFVYTTLLVVSAVWCIGTLTRGVIQGLLIATGTIVLSIVLCSVSQLINIVTSPIQSAVLLITAFGLTFTIVSCLIISLSFALIRFLTHEKYQRSVKVIYCSSLIAIASLFSRFTLIPPDAKSTPLIENLSSSSLESLTLAFGGLLGLGAVTFGLIATRYKDVPWKRFDFLRSWAITIASWRGTSFYDLDLSQVNFAGAQLANTDLRSRKLYRTCFQGAQGLDRARVDNRYLDLAVPKVQKLLTRGCCEDLDFSLLNLRGAYLRGADLRRMNFTDADLIGADLTDADMRDAILARAQVIDVDFTNANLTGICIADWSVNSQTIFTNVQCDYIYRKLDDQGKPCDRYPLDRDFEPREFESLYQEVGNVVELIFKEGVNFRAVSFSLQKLQLEDEGLGLELKGIERRGDLWVVKVSHNENVSGQVVEQRLAGVYQDMQQLLAAKEQQINQLLGIVADQAEAMKGLSKQPFGNHFLITGSTITNLAGSGQIEYREAADQVRSLVAHAANPIQVKATLQNFVSQVKAGNVATSSNTFLELMQQLLLKEAENDPIFKQFLFQQGQQVIAAMPNGAIASVMQQAIAQLRSNE